MLSVPIQINNTTNQTKKMNNQQIDSLFQVLLDLLFWKSSNRGTKEVLYYINYNILYSYTMIKIYIFLEIFY